MLSLPEITSSPGITMKSTLLLFSVCSIVLNGSFNVIPPESTAHRAMNGAIGCGVGAVGVVANEFKPTIENKTAPRGKAPKGMVWIPGGEFSMGSDDSGESLCDIPGITKDAQPIHRVFLDGYWMDETEVTNEQFAAFVQATGYITVAEKKPTKEEFPTAPEANLIAGSTVFTPTSMPVPLNNMYQWWGYEAGANWRHPTGPKSNIQGKGN